MKKLLFILLLLQIISYGVKAQKDIMKETFAAAPDSTRTRVWWFWGETIVTREGIKADLESMKKVGIGGVVLYEQLFANRSEAIKSLSPEWFSLVEYAASECARLGLQFDITVSSGYCAGGPWITPDLAMQRLISSELNIHGGQHFSGKIPTPVTQGDFYRDAVLLAYKATGGESTTTLKNKIRFSTNHSALDPEKLFSSDVKSEVKIAPDVLNRFSYINLEFPTPFTARSISYTIRPSGKMIGIAMQFYGKSSDSRGYGFNELPPIGQLEASDDGQNFSKVCDLQPIYSSHESWKNLTQSFSATKAKYFRLNLHDWGYNSVYKDSCLVLGNVVLREEPRIDQWELKAANRSEMIIKGNTPTYAPAEVISDQDYLNITSLMKPDGQLEWDVPAGDWKIIRLGYTNTGAKTKHGRPEAMGLECDKLNVAGIDFQFQNYPQRILTALKDHTGVKVKSITIDSAEHGDQNWTNNFKEEFKKRRGYDPTPYLPAMMGFIITSTEVSERFLHDVRRTIADMLADNYFGELNNLARKSNLLLTAQAPGNAICIHGDPIQCKSRVDIPQGEFWANNPAPNYDVREAASTAHLYNKPIASAEAYTGAKLAGYPDFYKSFADGAYAMGINEFVICASTQQPWLDRKPGNMTNGWPDMNNRNATWWDYSREFWDYQSRVAYMMRQGKTTVDICYYLGENIPIKILSQNIKPTPPSGTDFDVCNPEALLNRFSVANGKIMLPDGAGYHLLVLPDTIRMSLPIARKIKTLVAGGAVILGRYPVCSPTLSDLGKGDEEVRAIADELWGSNKNNPSGVHPYGKGKVYWGTSIEAIMNDIGLKPDVSNGKPFWDQDILFTHRKTDNEHIYFIANHKDQPEKSTFTFRVGGMQPELWDPLTGETRNLTQFTTDGKTTTLPLEFYPQQSFLIVYRKPIKNSPASATPNFPTLRTLQTLQGSWKVHFDPRWGGPETTTFETLTSWSKNSLPGIKFYSGTARYEKEFLLSAQDIAAGKHLLINLGKVANIACVYLNGKRVGNVWCKPWQSDISCFAVKGVNKLEIEVANLWTNRLIGDSGLPEEQRIAYATSNSLTPKSTLTESGLLGPVTIIAY
ncbi:MAG: glycosyl hydrolase [Bacteroidota bacterium]|nr:glycosyl hydrolase [Bacteroidota bacterium]